MYILNKKSDKDLDPCRFCYREGEGYFSSVTLPSNSFFVAVSGIRY